MIPSSLLRESQQTPLGGIGALKKQPKRAFKWLSDCGATRDQRLCAGKLVVADSLHRRKKSVDAPRQKGPRL
jgi:hypothetical protein